jgi:uncharacterized protein (DUF4415 family)
MHPDQKAAESCVIECKQKFLNRAGIDDLEGVELRFGQRNRPRYISKPKPQKVKLIPPYRIRRMVDDADVDKEIEAATNAQDGEAEQAPKVKKEPTVKRKADLKDKFIRQGAEYQCTFCMKLYYTKVEVLACFDAHPDEQIIDEPAAS